MSDVLCPIAYGRLHYPKAHALATLERLWTFEELDQATHACMLKLREWKISHRYPLAFLAKNNWHTIVLFFALFRLGIIACPLSPRLPPLQLTQILEEIKATLLTPFEIESAPFSLQEATIQSEQPATLLFTSGSTGKPKIACHSFQNYYYNAVGSNQISGLSLGDRWLLSLPLYHVGGLAILFRCFLSGATVVLPHPTLSSSLKHQSISFLSLVPTQLFRLIKEPPSFLEKCAKDIRCILLGGAPISAPILKQAADAGLKLCPTYGMTEMSSQITMNLQPTASCGKVLPFREIHTSSDGEILVRGKTLFLGYWDPQAGLQLPLNSEGWFFTSDYGEINSTGELYFKGRKDLLFISGGENIQPEEIEIALLTLPGILDAVVVPLEDEEFGARPVAFLQKQKDEDSSEKILEQLTNLLPRFKLPIYFFPMSDDSKESPLKKNRKYYARLAKELVNEIRGPRG